MANETTAPDADALIADLHPEADLGAVTWETSGEDEGPDVGQILGLGGGKILRIGEVTKSAYDDAPETIKALGDDGGVWLTVGIGGEPLARFHSMEAATTFFNFMLDAVAALRAHIAALKQRAEKAEEWNRQMVAKAAEKNNLEGYRELARKLADAEAERDAALARLHRIKRMGELSASIMRDVRRTGAWEGSERVARGFERIAYFAAQKETPRVSIPTKLPPGVKPR